MSDLAGGVVWAGIKLLELLFAAGIVGSALVILLTGIEDIKSMFITDNPEKK